MTDTAKTVAEVDLSGLRIPKAFQHDAGQILAPTTPFCAESLDEEYGQLCRSRRPGYPPSVSRAGGPHRHTGREPSG